MDRRIRIIVQIHAGFAFYPTGIVAIHTSCQSHTDKLSPAFDSVNDCVGTTLLNRVLLAIGGMEITSLRRNLLISSGDNIKELFILVTTVFHRDPSSLMERHLKIAVIATTRSYQHHGRIQHRIFAIPVHEIFIIGTSEECRERSFHRRIFLIIPIHTDDKMVPYISGKPHMLDHTRSCSIYQSYGFPCRNRHGRTKLGAVTALGTTCAYTGWILCGKCKRFGVLDHTIVVHILLLSDQTRII